MINATIILNNEREADKCVNIFSHRLLKGTLPSKIVPRIFVDRYNSRYRYYHKSNRPKIYSAAFNEFIDL